MKTTTILMHSCMVVSAIAFDYQAHAQAQPMQAVNPVYIAGKEAAATFSYKIFQAPNKMYGYDIFRDGEIIFHQGASPIQPNDIVAALSKKEHADKAALLTIEKIKNGQPAALTQEELRKISVQ